MSFGFKFGVGSSGATQIVSSDAFFGAIVLRQIVQHKVLTTLDFSGTSFSDYYVNYWYRGGVTTFRDDFGTRPITSESVFLIPPTITLNKTTKQATVFWDVLANQINPYNAVYDAQLEVIVMGV
jgi:hypothetical protein